MREILFRGKRIDNGEWVEGYLIHDEFCNTQIPYIGYLCGDSVDVAEVDPETVGQYTGLRDCTRTKEYPNGKRFFEGDIVYDGFTKDKVVFEDCQWKLVDRHGTWIELFDREVEVIGNIHDNPELLEVDHDER